MNEARESVWRREDPAVRDAYTTLLAPWKYASTGVITTEVRDG